MWLKAIERASLVQDQVAFIFHSSTNSEYTNSIHHWCDTFHSVPPFLVPHTVHVCRSFCFCWLVYIISAMCNCCDYCDVHFKGTCTGVLSSTIEHGQFFQEIFMSRIEIKLYECERTPTSGFLCSMSLFQTNTHKTPNENWQYWKMSADRLLRKYSEKGLLRNTR